MKKYLSIGKIANIVGLSVQTIRYYCNIGLLKPVYVNPNNNYRYFDVKQIQLIDKIKYLQNLGMSLQTIKHIILNEDADSLVSHLNIAKKECTKEINRLQDVADSISWYKNYISYPNCQESERCYCIKNMDLRYLFAVEHKSGETDEDLYAKFYRLKNSGQYKDLNYQGQICYILDYDSFIKNQIHLIKLGMPVKEPPKNREHILRVEEGKYLCFQQNDLSQDWDTAFISCFFKKASEYILAFEFRKSFHNPNDSIYEFQIHINGTEEGSL